MSANPTHGWDPLRCDAGANAFLDPLAEAHAAGYAEGQAAAAAELQVQAPSATARFSPISRRGLAAGTHIDRGPLAERLRATVLHLVTRIVGEVGIAARRARRAGACRHGLPRRRRRIGDAARAPRRCSRYSKAACPPPSSRSATPNLARGSFVLESASTMVEDGPEAWLEQLASGHRQGAGAEMLNRFASAFLDTIAETDFAPRPKVAGRLSSFDGLLMEATGLTLPVGTVCRVGEETEAEVIGFRSRPHADDEPRRRRRAPPRRARPPDRRAGRGRSGRCDARPRRRWRGQADRRARPDPRRGQLAARRQASVPARPRPRARADGRRRPRDQRAAHHRPRPADRHHGRLGRRQVGAARHDGQGRRGRCGRHRPDRRALAERLPTSSRPRSQARRGRDRSSSQSPPTTRRCCASAARCAPAPSPKPSATKAARSCSSWTRSPASPTPAARSDSHSASPPPRVVTRPSAIAMLPNIIERAGADANGPGSITAIYTVLADGDDGNDPGSRQRAVDPRRPYRPLPRAWPSAASIRRSTSAPRSAG